MPGRPDTGGAEEHRRWFGAGQGGGHRGSQGPAVGSQPHGAAVLRVLRPLRLQLGPTRVLLRGRQPLGRRLAAADPDSPDIPPGFDNIGGGEADLVLVS